MLMEMAFLSLLLHLRAVNMAVTKTNTCSPSEVPDPLFGPICLLSRDAIAISLLKYTCPFPKGAC